MRAGRSKISTVANRPSHTVDSIVSAVVGVSSGTRKLSTWLVRRLIGEVPLLAMATVDTSPYNHQPGVADPSRDLGPLLPPTNLHPFNTLRPHPHKITPPPKTRSHVPATFPTTRNPCQTNHFPSPRPIGTPFPPAPRAGLRPGNSTYPPLG